MKDLPPLEGLSSEEKDALIRELWAVVQALQAEVERLKGKGVKTTSRNSSLPPAKGFKPNSEDAKPQPSERAASVGRAGGGRELSASPDQVVVAQVNRCPHCGSEVERARQQLKAVYERIELPQVRPQVTRVERYGGQCSCCQQ
ncbi:IS66 family transposase, partial [Nodosilinea sp. LEGE 07298]|nr:IS66 family transposase [Nodosilinea sp. LEGE 07298]